MRAQSHTTACTLDTCGYSGKQCPHPIFRRSAPQHMVRFGIVSVMPRNTEDAGIMHGQGEPTIRRSGLAVNLLALQTLSRVLFLESQVNPMYASLPSILKSAS